ncbi:uncharacterized protein LOC130957009 [Arachis stenosperma]|uniref:uncharacterized protein LOC130957009 n=1 Tax=Arachis stenosperma TaxID=217475 RepID=UPI0025AD95F3|nr:uncharacterized protein LOC130957009 [Arachis stenosperma]
MAPNRSWMSRRQDCTGHLSEEFKKGVVEFIDFVERNPTVIDSLGHILCPCTKCKNRLRDEIFWVEKHLCDRGFMEGYINWTAHGEERWVEQDATNVTQEHEEENTNPYVDMVIDAAGDNLNIVEGLEEDPNPSASKFYKLMRSADEPLWDGCTKHTILSAVTQLVNLKSEFNMSESCYNRMVAIIKSMLPESEKLPEDFYRSKTMIQELGLGYEKIDACPNHCMLYYRETSDKISYVACTTCGHPRFKPKGGDTANSNRDVPYSILRYFPITPRLQRLFMSKTTAQYMKWHVDGVRQDESVITHPADADAWKQFDATHKIFAQESRNVRFGLCTDGFNPFSGSKTPYSCWPVFVTPYNLPPSMCMRREYIFLSLLIPGPKSPGKKLDVYLRPLIDELKILWDNGVTTYDAWEKKNFNMKAALLWTISDFPAYGMLFGWSTHGRLSCPICMKNTKSFRLQHDAKPCWFDCHRQYLPPGHAFRRDRYSFKKSTVENTFPPKRMSGVEILNELDKLEEANLGANPRGKKGDFGTIHNWVRKSIFWELPYWSTNLIRHNLDIMHIEKNVFDNIFNTVMDVKGKTKDNANAREDLKIICKRPNLELVFENGKCKKPKATYVLDSQQRRTVCEWIKQLKFPDGYASNISQCINLADGKIYGMKSHDSHVFMERLIPLVFRDVLLKFIWGVLTELSLFFKQICATEICPDAVEKVEISIIETVCKLEKIFPPAFFDVMEHLVIHIPYEAKVGGPVQYRWMYPFERCMLYLKRKVRNKARVEGSICEAYILEEISNFTSMYFESTVHTRRTQVPRNDDGGSNMDENHLSIFRYPCLSIGRGSKKYLTDEELHIAHTYILVNCEEIEPYLQQFEDSLKELHPNISEDEILNARDKDFSRWIKNQVDIGHIESRMIQQIAHGPSKSVSSYNGLKVNGYRFHTKDHDKNRATMNSGVCVKGNIYGENDLDYYGILEEILELSYLGYGNTYKSRLQSNEPFVLAEQAQQVYYTKYPHNGYKSSGEWWAACKVRAKVFMNETLHDPDEEPNEQADSNDFYQESVSELREQSVVLEDEVIALFDANAPMEEVNVEDINCPMDTLFNDEFINDNEEFDSEDSESASSEPENEDYVM